MSEVAPSVIGGRELPGRILHYIDGQHVASISGRTLAVDEPVSHRRYAELSAGDAEKIQRQDELDLRGGAVERADQNRQRRHDHVQRTEPQTGGGGDQR